MLDKLKEKIIIGLLFTGAILTAISALVLVLVRIIAVPAILILCVVILYRML